MNIPNQKFLASLTAAGLVTAGQAHADLSAELSLDYNSHFISYGFDVWGGGDDPQGTFNPSLSIDYKVNDALSLNAGFWLDVNDNGGGPFETVETDVWIGASYTSGITTASLTLQNWQYGGTSEGILDLGLSFDTLLSPSITIHKRLDEGASGGFNGTFLVLGAEHSFDVNEQLSITIPVSVGFAIDEFHTTETGYGFASIGLSANYTLNEMTSIHAGVTYWDTDSAVTGNAEESFYGFNAGISFSF
ncbi:MAG: hypothetical protein ACJAQT_002459 [Akkermansiaceae bacterium]|jgi:hypothetical protein